MSTFRFQIGYRCQTRIAEHFCNVYNKYIYIYIVRHEWSDHTRVQSQEEKVTPKIILVDVGVYLVLPLIDILVSQSSNIIANQT